MILNNGKRVSIKIGCGVQDEISRKLVPPIYRNICSTEVVTRPEVIRLVENRIWGRIYRCINGKIMRSVEDRLFFVGGILSGGS